uniref:Uncharacterized protein n=1 Tax=Physcomitrium patens TaxID=3218 RepID=A0A2K1IAN1_PHYPA|nr:hypothetical protein PHYPA_030905 [Physcomitrium patens]
MKNESLHREQKYECLSETGFFFLEWTIRIKQAVQSEVSILGPVGYGPTTLPLRHSDCVTQ